ncbi:MAG: hypothetical protein J5645_01415 [Lachnospiraceae bacterium]|nr:hypothetical protein [Lachnospiraceae bacterium]
MCTVVFMAIHAGVVSSILREYGLAIGTALFVWVLLPLLVFWLIKKVAGEGLGPAVVGAIGIRIVGGILAVLAFVVNPIRIAVKYWGDLTTTKPLAAGIACLVLVLILIPAAALFLIPNTISNFIFRRKYNTGAGEYTVDPANYKRPADFQKELDERGLAWTWDDRKLLNSLHAKYNPGMSYYGVTHGYYYTESVMMAVTGDTFIDDYKKENAILPDEMFDRSPAYIYNSVLVVPPEGGKLRYAALGRYGKQDSMSGNKFPFFDDFYIECKIMYVDGDLYAIIGVDECFAIHKDKRYSDFERPFYVILSEKDHITTYVDGKYYPRGAIELLRGEITMVPNTRERSWVKLYPVRRVDRLDVDTINRVAAEIQQQLTEGAN